MRNVLLSALVLALGLPACSGCSEKAKDAPPQAAAPTPPAAAPAASGLRSRAMGPSVRELRTGTAGLNRPALGPGAPLQPQTVTINGKRVLIKPSRRLSRMPNGALGPARAPATPAPAAPAPSATPAPQQ